MTKLYPLMPLRDIVIFPHMVAPLVVGRKQSIQALEDAMDKKTDILLVTQKKSTVDEPNPDDLHGVVEDPCVAGHTVDRKAQGRHVLYVGLRDGTAVDCDLDHAVAAGYD